MYKYELHCHTTQSSACGRAKAHLLAEEYKKASYSGVVVTDHYNTRNFGNRNFKSQKEKADFFLRGYREMKRFESEDFIVMLGMEIKLEQNSNDYLLYGINESLVYNGDDLLKMRLKALHSYAVDNNLLLIQAHPFRDRMTVMPPRLLDGIEVANGNSRLENRNGIAKAWAEKYSLIQTGGSDCHRIGDVGIGGIITNEKLADSKDLIRILKSGKHEVIPCHDGEKQD